jgi:hypothetical protein
MSGAVTAAEPEPRRILEFVRYFKRYMNASSLVAAARDFYHGLLTLLPLIFAGTSLCAAQTQLDLDLPGITRLKDYSAYRSSSNNPNLASNDDSVRPIAGETVVLADLEGPGVVTHIWLTVAANEYAWPRLRNRPRASLAWRSRR